MQKKADNPNYNQGIGSCRLNSIQQLINGKLQTTQTIHYDDAGRITNKYTVAVTGGVEIDSYVYAGNDIFIFIEDSLKTVRFIDTVMLDNAGRVSSDNAATSRPGARNYYYNTDGSLSRLQDTSFTYKSALSEFYTWQNGDIIIDSSNRTSPPRGYYYTYDTTKLWQVVSPFTIYWFGNLSCHPKHLPIVQEIHDLGGRVTIIKFRYCFDGQGKITSDTNFSGDLIHQYGYECY